MKKEDIAGLVVYMFIIAVAIVYSLTVLRTHFDHSAISSVGEYALMVILSLLAGIVSSSLLIELGHICGAAIGKYEITSVCILYFTFFKEDKKWKFKFSSFDGLTGETKIKPKGSESKPSAYLLFPTLFLAIWGIACFAIFSIYNTNVPKSSDLAYFFLTICVVTLICLIYNILPLKLDTKTDGYGLRMMSNHSNKSTYNEMLIVQDEVGKGNDEIEIKTYSADELSNYTAELNMNKVNVLLDKKEYDEANQIIDITLDNKDKVSYKIFLHAFATKIFIKAMTNNVEDTTAFLNENVNMDMRRDLSDENSFTCIRAYILLEALTDNSKSECLRVIGKVNTAYKRTHKNRRALEGNMYNDCIDYVIKVHPKWEFEQYKITLDDNK